MTRRKVLVLVATIVVLLPGHVGYPVHRPRVQVDSCRDCLPEHLTLDTEFCESESHAGRREKATTIRDKLIRLGAYTRDGKLYDGTGREIRFYPMDLGTFGTPKSPEVQKRRWEEAVEHNDGARKLRKRYTVVEMWPIRRPL